MTNETHDRMHELLCAYVLGEVSADERAEVERALEASAELRQEKERVEATIGMVKTVLVADETLSAQKRDEVLRAALPPVVRPPAERLWWGRTWVRAAAAVFVVSFGFAGWTIYQKKGSMPAPNSEVASRATDRDDETRKNARDAGDDASVLAPRPELAAVPQDQRAAGASSVGYEGGGSAAMTSSLPAAPFGASAPASKPAGQPAAPAPDPTLMPGSSLQDMVQGFRATDEVQGAGKETDAVRAEFNRRFLEAQKLARDSYVGPGDSVPGRAGAPPAEGSRIYTQDFDVSSDKKVAEVLYGEPFEKRQGELKNEEVLLLAEAKLKQTRADGSTVEQERSKALTAGGDSFSATSAGLPVLQSASQVDLSKAAPIAPGQKGGQGGAGGGAGASGPASPAPSGPSTGGAGTQPGRAAEPVTVSGFIGTGAESLQAGGGQPPQGGVKDSLEQEIARFEREQSASRYRFVNDDVNVPSGGVQFAQPVLTDEDQFILERLGLQKNDVGGWTQITPEIRARYREEYVDHWCKRIVTHCRRLPNEKPRDMFFRFWGDNPFEYAGLDPLSTFSADVDTASYTLARRYINEGHLPEKAQVRTEEFVNAFKADVPPPTKGVFGVYTTLAPSRFGAANPGESITSARDMLRVVVRGKDVAKAERKPLALTFVVDCSGSMKEQNRMEMVKHSMRLLASQLDARDSIAIVKFSTDAAMVLPMTSGKNRDLIESAIQPLRPDGSTNSEAGLRMGYAAALAGLNVEATNRVVFLSDGVANVGVTDPSVISEGVRAIREKGVYLNTIGVGMNNHNDVLLEQLADKGDGVCNYVDTAEEAKKVFVDQFMGAVETIARDVKIQVEFDPTQVMRYRLLGYENRAVADVDFRNDKVDAGEVGAGHQVTALYEIEYANPSAKAEKPLATVRVRYKLPRNPGAPMADEEATEIAQPVSVAQRVSWEGAGPGYRRSAVVGQFAEFLRRSVHARDDSFDQMIADARRLEVEARDTEVAELVTLMEKSKAMILNGWPGRDELSMAVDSIRERCVRQAQLETMAQERDREMLAQLEMENRRMEERLREMIRRRLDGGK